MTRRAKRAIFVRTACAVAALTALAHTTPARAAPKSVSAYSACMNRAQSTRDMQECQTAGLLDANARLATAYAAALAKLPADQRAKLRKAQALWTLFRKTDCQVFYGAQTGTVATIRGGACVLERTEHRIEDMHDFSND
jgi:uncharacterized protein YecT (DUF1311 family)